MPEVRRHDEQRRYEITVDGTVVGFVTYEEEPGRVVLVHTEVDEARRVRGLASQLVQFALDDIRARDLRVVPVCPFVARFIERHAEYADLVDQEALRPRSNPRRRP